MKKQYITFLLAVAGSGLNSLSWGQCFVTTDLSLTTQATSVVVGDFNGDGRPDMATANLGAGTVSVKLNNGSGGFNMSTNYPSGNRTLAITTGDFNSDGRLDLAAANEGSNTVSVLLNTGGGNFGPTTSLNVGISPESVIVGDFNGDGRPDLATANILGNTVSVVLNSGNGRFSPAVDLSVPGAPTWVAAGDVNADGRPDLITANLGTASVSVLLGTGNGSFGPPVGFGVNDDPGKVLIGDFNGDGKPDLATANYFGNTVSILLGNGGGSFSNPVRFGVGNYPISLAMGDFNGDGKPDLVTANINDNTLSVLLGNGDGSFGSPAYFGASAVPRSVAVGDFNGDGKPDLVVVYSGATFSLLTNCSITPATNLSLNQPMYDCTTGQLTLSATGGNNSLVEYRIAGLRDWAAGTTFTVPTYQRNGTNFILEARQNGQVVSLPFLAACTSATPPPAPGPPTSTGLSLIPPAYICTDGLLQLGTTGGNGKLIEYRVAGLRDWSSSNSFLVPTYQLVGTSFTLEARQSGQVTSRPFISACQSTTSIPPFTPPAPKPLIINSITANCQTGSVQLTTEGGNGTLVEYRAPGLRDWGSSPFFTIPAYQRNGITFVFYARQTGQETSNPYGMSCPNSTRLASAEAGSGLGVEIYPNPVGEQFTVGVSGVSGQSVRFHLTNLNGQTVVEQRAQAVSDAHTETLKLPASGAGLYLLQVSTDSQSKTVKVLKP